MWGNWSQHVSYLSCSRFNIPRVTWGLLSGSVGFVIGIRKRIPIPQNPTNPKSPCSLQNRFTPRRTIGYEIGRCSLHSVSHVLMTAPYAQVPVARNDATRAPKSTARFVKPRRIKRVSSKQCGARVAERIVVERKGGQTRGAPGPPLPPCHCFVVCGRRRRDDSVRTAGDSRRHARNRACRGGSMRAHRGPPL